MIETFFLLININFILTLFIYSRFNDSKSQILAYLYAIINFLLVILFCVILNDFSSIQKKIFIYNIFLNYNISLVVGVDTISILFLILETFLFPIILMAS
jgi:NADH:ubiquinone oxidoreductase subunit 4 (subunit M)